MKDTFFFNYIREGKVPPENNIWLYYYKLILLWTENKRQSYVPTLYCPVNVLKPGS